METKELQELGLSEGEAQIYLALLKNGKSNVMELAKITGRHRTHIYDTIEKLKERGLVSESIIDNKKFLIASSPDNLLSYLKEKEEKTLKLVEDLKKFSNTKEKILVETYYGISGLKTALRDILNEKKDYVGYGEGGRFGKIIPEFYEQFRGKSDALGIGLRLILKKGVKISLRKKLQVKYLDYISPSTTFIYADKILIIIWEPFPTAIRITNKQTTDSYRNYFELLWEVAKN